MQGMIEHLEARRLFLGTTIADRASLGMLANDFPTLAVHGVTSTYYYFSVGDSEKESYFSYDGRSMKRLFAGNYANGTDGIGAAGGYLFYNVPDDARDTSQKPGVWALRMSDRVATRISQPDSDLRLVAKGSSRILFTNAQQRSDYYRFVGGSKLVKITEAEADAWFPVAARTSDAVEVNNTRYYTTRDFSSEPMVTTVWKAKLDGSRPTAIYTTTRGAAIVPHGQGVLLTTDDGTYLPNGRAGAFKWFSNGIKRVAQSNSAASIGNFLVSRNRSLDLRTGEVRILFGRDDPGGYGGNVVAAGGLAFLSTGITDGVFFTPDSASNGSAHEFKGRYFLWDVNSVSLRQTTESVRGEVFNDDNRNSIHDAGESPSVGVRVYADVNGDGKRQSREPSAITNKDGRYSLFDLTGTRATIRVRPDDEHLDPGPRRVELGSTATERNFGLMPAVTIKGVAFTDINQNGRQDDLNLLNLDIALDFWLDLNRNGIADANEPISISRTRYSFGGLSPGTYQIRARITQSPTPPISPWPDLVLTTPAMVEVKILSGSKSRNFGVYTTNINFP